MRVYLVLCVASFLAGYGILAAVGLSRRLSGALLAAPGVTLAALVIIVGNGVWLGASVPALGTFIVAVTILFGTLGAYDLIKAPPPRRDLLLAVAAALCTVLVLAPFFRWGLTRYAGSWFYDILYYVAYAQFLIDAGRPNVADFITSYLAIHHIEMSSRYIAASLIAVLSVLGGGPDAQTGYGPLIALAVLVYASACAFLAIVWGRAAALVLAFMLLAVTGGWVLGVVQANNLDSLLVLALTPLLMAVARLAGTFRIRDAVLFGVIFSAIFWTQVELLPIACAVVAIELGRRLWVSGASVREWVVWAAATAGVVLVTAGAWIAPSVRFFLHQLQSATAAGAARPGIGYYAGLFDARCALSSIWGFWAPGDWWVAPADRCAPLPLVVFFTTVAVVFTLCLVAGLVRFIRQRDYVFPLALAVILAGAAYMAIGQRYDYGAYKFLSTGWFVAAMIMMEGVVAAAMALSVVPAMAYAAVFLILLVPQGMIVSVRWARFDTRYIDRTIEPYRKAVEVRQIVKDDPLIVAISHPVAVQWFVFFLRDMKLVTVNRSHAYFHVFDARSVPKARRNEVIGKVQWVATDPAVNLACRGFRLVWQGAPYHLWKSDTPSQIFATELARPELTHDQLPELRCPAG
jgi:hypothetical protein